MLTISPFDDNFVNNPTKTHLEILEGKLQRLQNPKELKPKEMLKSLSQVRESQLLIAQNNYNYVDDRVITNNAISEAFRKVFPETYAITESEIVPLIDNKSDTHEDFKSN